MSEYLILFAIVFGIHLAPAFTPPTWPVILLYSLNRLIPLPLLVVSAAVAAALGRYTLACASGCIGHRLPERTRRNLGAACAAIERRRRSRMLVTGLFVITPLPSAQLFEAAGLSGARLVGLTAAYFVGRLGYYSLYATGAHMLAETSLGQAFHDKLTSPAGIALQIAALALLVALIRVNWVEWLTKGSARSEPRTGAASP